jgi:hypothetical protein
LEGYSPFRWMRMPVPDLFSIDGLTRAGATSHTPGIQLNR